MARRDTKEPFRPDHKQLDDAALLAPPEPAPFTPLALFVCTYVAKLGSLHMGFVHLTALMCEDPRGPLLAINSNFGHACQPGYEHLLKLPKPPAQAPRRLAPTRGRARKVQGDGTCFNSAVEPTLAIDHPGIDADKVYKVKCFPTTGETQIPGVIRPDLSDGRAVLEAFVAYLNGLGVGDEGPDGVRATVTVLSEQPKMLNYKFRLTRSSPRVLVNLRALALYMQALEQTRALEGEGGVAWAAHRPALLLPPYLVRETKPPTDDVKVSFRFRGASRSPRVNVFREGKVNILGADTETAALRIYAYFEQLFTVNWAALVCLQPRCDLERRAAPPPAPPPTPTPVPPPAPVPTLGAVGVAAGIYRLQDLVLREVDRKDVE
jgi:hypothetical protein